MTHVQRPSSRGVHGIGRSPLAVFVTVGLAILLGAAPASAITWTQTTLDTTLDLALQDAAFKGHNVAVAFQVPGPIIRLRTSTSSGSSFASDRIDGFSRQAAVDICGSKLYVVSTRDYSDGSHPNRWQVDLTIRSMSGADLGSRAVSTEDLIARYPDVACAGGRLYVSWEQKVGTQWHVFVAQALRSSPIFSASPIDLGRMAPNAGHPVVAGVSGRAYVAWPTFAGSVRIHRWGIGSGPDYTITDLGERQLAGSGNTPRIAAQGDKVVVAWYDCGDIRARVSTNRGGNWGSTRTIFTGVCGSEFGGVPQSVAVEGARTVVSYYFFSGYENQKMRMITTSNNFSSKSDRLAYAASDLLLLGYITPSGTTTLAGAVDTGSVLRFLREP